MIYYAIYVQGHGYVKETETHAGVIYASFTDDPYRARLYQSDVVALSRISKLYVGYDQKLVNLVKIERTVKVLFNIPVISLDRKNKINKIKENLTK